MPGLETLQTFPIAVVSLILIGFGIATISLASFFNIIESYNIAGLPLTDITTVSFMQFNLWKERIISTEIRNEKEKLELLILVISNYTRLKSGLSGIGFFS